MTLNSYPPAYASVNDNLIWTFYDAHAVDTSLTDYKYVGELWIDGVKVYTERAYPRPDNANGVFDFAPVIRGYVDPVFNPGTGVLAQTLGAAEFITKNIVVKIREEYDGSVGGVVFTDTARKFYNHYNYRGEGLASIQPFADKVLSNRGKVIELTRETPYYFLPFFADTDTGFVVKANDISVYTYTATANTCAVFNISPAAINAESPGTITDADESYMVNINGEVYTVNIVCSGLYRNYLLHFMNKFGAWDSMLFNKVSRRSIDIEKKKFKQLPYSVSGAGAVVFANGVIQREQRKVFAVKTNERLNIQTDWVTDTDYQWLGELNASPLIYLEDAGKLYPVDVTNSNYQYREYVVDRLTTLQLDIELPTSKNTQYR